MAHNETEMKSWRCKQGHTMGLVVRKNRVRQLLLLRKAVKSPGYPVDMTEEMDIMAVVEGYVADVRCSLCGEVRTWVPGEEAMRKLLRQARKELVNG